MAKKKVSSPSLDRLKAQLLTSDLSQKNPALFQVINQLIDSVRLGLNQLQTAITKITPSGSGSSSSTIITSGAGVMGIDNFGQDGSDGLQGIQGPQGLRGLIGPMGPPGIDGECSDCWCISFIGNSITDSATLVGTYVQRIP